MFHCFTSSVRWNALLLWALNRREILQNWWVPKLKHVKAEVKNYIFYRMYYQYFENVCYSFPGNNEIGGTWMVFLIEYTAEFHKQKCIVSINSTYNYKIKLQLFPFMLQCYLCRNANVKKKKTTSYQNLFSISYYCYELFCWLNLEIALPDLNWQVLLFHFLLL